MSFAIGSLVRARGREWVVLPESQPEKQVLMLRPLGGTDEEIAGVYLPLEPIAPASFDLPDPRRDLGSHLSCRLLRDAARLGFRSAAGPFRSLSRIAVEPRPYQIVPLMMALRQEPVRLLIADDVGIGKTIEALLIARELLDRGEVRRVAVITPPPLAEQWQRAMREQFHIDATLVLPGTAARLERDLGPGESLFDHHPFVVVSMDWVKSERRRETFVNHCPELVIVDEAHTCTAGSLGRASQQRHDLLKRLAKSKDRHVVLVTATPHSGNREAFRSLLALLDADLVGLPEDLSGEANRSQRERVARFLVQRRRDNLARYLGTDTPFPERKIAEESYTLAPEYRKFLGKVLAWCREQVLDRTLDERRQRVRWWSALALLRSISSSPAAAAATLRNRTPADAAETVEEANAAGRHVVFDQAAEGAETTDVVPGSQETGDEPDTDRRRMLRLAAEADALRGGKDLKLRRMTELLGKLVAEGWSPILFCRFIPTVDYVAEQLRAKLPKDIHVEAITGDLAPEEREARVTKLFGLSKKVLVCTDCLAEGVNLQEGFDAVVHYDLAWSPTRHEQREGRVDRFGQKRKEVRALTFFGRDNPVDGIVIDILLKKHRTIHKQLGVIVPVPMDTDGVVEAVLEGLLLRGDDVAAEQLVLDFGGTKRAEVDVAWDAAVDREKKSRTLFAQQGIKVQEVADELAATRRVLGDELTVESFVRTALACSGVPVSKGTPCKVDLRGAAPALKDALGDEGELRLSFRLPAERDSRHVGRTDPLVAGLAAYVLETALDPSLKGPARRCGAITTQAVSRRTTLLLLRARYHIVTKALDGADRELLAEDLLTVGFGGSPERPEWLPDEAVESLLGAEPAGNVGDEIKELHVQRVIEALPGLTSVLNERIAARGQELFQAHTRVRSAAKLPRRSLRVEVAADVADRALRGDVLGVFVLMPAAD